jgi:hypothetical protein
MSLLARIITSFSVKLTSALDLSSSENNLISNYEHIWRDGAGADQASLVFEDRRAVGFGATDSVDLSGSLAGPLGGTLAFAKIKEIFIKADEANAGNLRVGKAISNTFVGPFGAAAVGMLVEPGGILHLRTPSAAGWAVVAATADLLGIENLAGSGNGNYDIIVIGA